MISPQATQAQNKNTIELYDLRYKTLYGKFTLVFKMLKYLNMGLSLCLVCNLGTIRGRFRRVFGLVLFALLFLHLKQRKAGD